MNETLKRFEGLAEEARAGDEQARATFFSEAERLFPAVAEESGTKGEDRVDRVLALIRQSVTTGG
jgi:hypothetical protein